MLLCNTAFADNYNYARMPGSFAFGADDNGAVTSFTLDSALVYGTSGKSYGVLHLARESQTSGNLSIYFYCTGASGSPTASATYIYKGSEVGEDPDRPDTGGTAQYTSDTVDMTSCSTAGWKKYSFTGVTTVASQVLWFLNANTTATPASNSYNLLSRSPLDTTVGHAGVNTYHYQHNTYTNTSGWTADGTGSSIAPVVVCYNSGNCYGNPYVATTTHATNTNLRGNRWTPTEDVYVSGFYGAVDPNFGGMRIYQGSTLIWSYSFGSFDDTLRSRSSGTEFSPILLTGGLPYDFVFVPSASDNFGNIYTMGNSPPSDVTSTGLKITYVDGTAGSLTETTTSFMTMAIIISEAPAISSGGGTGTINISGGATISGGVVL